MNGKLNNLLFYGQENNNTNQNYNNIKINSNQNYYNYNKPIKTDFSLENHMSFKGKFEKPENIDFYIHPVTDAYENINDSNNSNIYHNQGGIHTDVNIKNKIMKINSSLKSFNILVKNKFINYNDFENNSNKNFFINHLLDYIIDLIWIIKEEGISKDNVIEKLNSSNFKYEEYEKKIKKINNELGDTKKYLNNMLNKNIYEKDKVDQSKKVIESDITGIKSENKKLNLQILTLKNEIKKKELEYNKIQEKLKKFLNEKILNSTVNNGNNFNKTQNNNNDIFKITNLLQLDNTKNEFEINNMNNFKNNTAYYKKFLEFNVNNNFMSKYNTIINKNSCLMNLLYILQEFLDKIHIKIITFNKTSTKLKIENIDMIKLKQSLFSEHLLDKNLLEEFADNFTDNIKLIESYFSKILEILIKDNKDLNNDYLKLEKEYLNYKNKYNEERFICDNNNNNIFLNPTKEKDMIKNIKKWSVSKVNLHAPIGNKLNEKKWMQDNFVGKSITYNNIDEKNESINIENSNYSNNDNKNY